MEWDFIHIYTRRQALEDGVLVDVTGTAKDLGFRFPVACTTTCFHEVVRDTAKGEAQDHLARLTEMLLTLRRSIRRQSGHHDRTDFKYQGSDLYAMCGPGDDHEPVITIMLLGED